MIRRGHKIIIACQPDSWISKRTPEYGIDVIEARLGGATDIKGIMNIRREIRRHDIDLVSTHSSKDSWTAGLAAKMAGVKVVRTRHLGELVSRGAAGRFIYGKLPDAVVTTGDVVLEHLVRDVRVRRDKVVSIPTGIDLDRFDPDRVDGSVFRNELGILPENILIGMLGMLRKVKGHSFLIEATAELIAEFPQLRVVLVGDIAFDSPIKERLHKEIAERGLIGKVLMPGYRTDVPQVLAAMDVFVHPSLEEGVSQAISQALAMKKPTVASDAGATKEQILDGETGLLVERGNSRQLATAIQRLLRNPEDARRMGENARKLVERKFSYEAMLDSTEEVYARLFL
jgi:glycosyltransferase involved in cell wall biosynthesis